MNQQFPFLKDDLALNEIRKHKWLESEKSGREVGFATAALDWIKKHGPAWQQARSGSPLSEKSLAEKRRFRRFRERLPIKLKIDSTHIQCHTDNFNLIGLACTVPDYIPHNTSAEVTIRFTAPGSAAATPRFRFRSNIRRVEQTDGAKQYHVFLPFNEEIRDFLRLNAGQMNEQSSGLN